MMNRPADALKEWLYDHYVADGFSPSRIAETAEGVILVSFEGKGPYGLGFVRHTERSVQMAMNLTEKHAGTSTSNCPSCRVLARPRAAFCSTCGEPF